MKEDTCGTLRELRRWLRGISAKVVRDLYKPLQGWRGLHPDVRTSELEGIPAFDIFGQPTLDAGRNVAHYRPEGLEWNPGGIIDANAVVEDDIIHVHVQLQGPMVKPTSGPGRCTIPGVAQKFAVMHEIGHARFRDVLYWADDKTSEKYYASDPSDEANWTANPSIDLPTVPTLFHKVEGGFGEPICHPLYEVGADAFAALMIARFDHDTGESRSTVCDALLQQAKEAEDHHGSSTIFDTHWVGDHPPATMRAEVVCGFLDALPEDNDLRKISGRDLLKQ